MGRLVQLSAIREKVRTRYDLPAFTSNTFVTTDMVTEMINSSIASYVGILQECEAEEYYTYEETLTTTAGQAWVSTTDLTEATFQALRSVSWVRGDQCVATLRRAQVDDWRKRSWGPQDWEGTGVRYCLMRERIYLMPPPSGEYTLRIFYEGIPPDLESGEDDFYAGTGWEEWIVSDVCRKIAEREQQDASRFVSARNDAERLIRSQYDREDAEAPTSRRLLLDQIRSEESEDGVY